MDGDYMDKYALESFIDFCNDMYIAEEGLLKKKPVSIKDAKNVNDMETLLGLTKRYAPLIKLSGGLDKDIKEKLKKAKTATNVNFAVAIASLALCLIGPAYSIFTKAGLIKIRAAAAMSIGSNVGSTIAEKKYGNLDKYKIYASKGNIYLLNRAYTIEEYQK